MKKNSSEEAMRQSPTARQLRCPYQPRTPINPNERYTLAMMRQS